MNDKGTQSNVCVVEVKGFSLRLEVEFSAPRVLQREALRYFGASLVLVHLLTRRNVAESFTPFLKACARRPSADRSLVVGDLPITQFSEISKWLLVDRVCVSSLEAIASAVARPQSVKVCRK